MAEHNVGITVGEIMLGALRRYPQRVALVDDRASVTYAQAERWIARCQKVFAGAGVRPGDGLAILSANRVENYLTVCAANLSGLRYTPLHPMGSLQDHLDILEDAEISALIVDATKHSERGREILSHAEQLQAVFSLGRTDFGTDLLAAIEDAGEATIVDRGAHDALTTLSYTGGTTGKPKGAVRTHSGAVAITSATLADFEFPTDIRLLATTPISHVGGTKILPTLLRGGTVFMQSEFSPDRFLDAVARHRITATLLVPTMLYVLLDHPCTRTADTASLQMVMYGASPMSPSRLEEAIEVFGSVFTQLYGQTECYPVSVLRKGDHDPRDRERLLSCGVPVSNAVVRLLDGDLNEVAVGAPGEICVRAPQAMEYYWKRPEETAATLKGGWLHTGDIAKQDQRGYLYIVDRTKDMIVSGGFNVYPREVEDVLSGHPAVAMAAVIGVPDEKWGEAVKAVVVPRAGKAVDTAALQSLVRQEKGPVYTPKSIDVVDAIPLTPIGKPDKKELRARYWQGRDRQVG